MRALGLDLGSKRVGIALSDSSGTIATPFMVLQRSKRRSEDHRAIHRLVVDEEVDVVVVGLPLNMDGSTGPAARAAIAEAAELATVVGVPVETCDERLTTVSADAVLLQAELDAPARRRVVDKVAAAVLLQSWLDSRHRRRPPEES